MPLDPRTWGELAVLALASLAPALGAAGAIALLGDDPRAFWLTGLLGSLLPAAWKLSSSGVPFWTGNGIALFALALGAALFLLHAGAPPGEGPA